MPSVRPQLALLLCLASSGACALPHGLLDGVVGDAASDGARPRDGAGGDVRTEGDALETDAAPAEDTRSEDVRTEGDAADESLARDGDVADEGPDAGAVDGAMMLDISTPSDVATSEPPGLEAGADAAPDVVLVAMDAGASADAAADVPVAMDVPRDAPPEAAPMDAAADVPVIDVNVTVDARPDVPADVPVDVPPVLAWRTVLTTTSNTPWHGGGSSGAAARCNPGELLVGLSIRHSQYVNALGLRCAALLPDGTFGPARTTDLRGGTNGTVADTACPAGQAIVRIEGRSGGVVDQLKPICGPVPGWYTSGTLGMVLGTFGRDGGGPWGDSCSTRQMAYGVDFDTAFFDSSRRVQSIRLNCMGVVP